MVEKECRITILFLSFIVFRVWRISLSVLNGDLFFKLRLIFWLDGLYIDIKWDLIFMLYRGYFRVVMIVDFMVLW